MRRGKLGVALTALALGAMGMAAGHAPAATIDVTTTTDEGINPGTGCALREAVEAANQNTDVGGCDTGEEVTGAYGAGDDRDTILLDAATYNLTMPGNQEDLNGGGDIDVFGSGPLTIRGAGGPNTVVRTDLSDRIFDVRAPLELRLETLTVTDGDAASAGGQSGGNLRTDVDGAAIVIDRVTVSNGTGVSGGGVQVNNEARFTSIDSSILANDARSSGGGVWLGFDSTGEFVRTSVRTNQNITSNASAQARGGGLLWAGDELSITDSSFSGNEVRGTDPGEAPNGFVTGGGAALTGDGDWTIRGSLFSGNAVSNVGPNEREEGGALEVTGTGDNLIVNTTILGNTAGDPGSAFGEGGAINYDTAAISASLTIAHSTLKDNEAVGPGGDQVHTDDASSAASSLHGSILTGPGADPCVGGVVSMGYNVADPDPSCGFGPTDSVSGAPIGLAATAAPNGGPTPTVALDPLGRAVDHVPAAACTAAGGIDQRGAARPNGPACDAGAFEAVSPPKPVEKPVPVPPKCKKAKKKGKKKGAKAGTAAKKKPKKKGCAKKKKRKKKK